MLHAFEPQGLKPNLIAFFNAGLKACSTHWKILPWKIRPPENPALENPPA
jgi:hypothetical protein